MNNYPFISIITPNFNYGRYIGKLIESVIDQNYPCIEHIIVDDGSTDNSVDIIKEYVNKYPDKIKLIIQENKGQTIAINRALQEVSGDIIGWINSDDFYNNNAFLQIINTFNKYKNADAVFGDINLIDDNNKIIEKRRYLPFNYFSGIFNGFGRIVSSNAIFWKTTLTKEIGLFNEEFHFAMDAEYWSRLTYKRKVVHINYPIAVWRQHSKAKTYFRQNIKSKEYIIAESENKTISRISYNRFYISKLLSFRYTFLLKLFFKVYRLTLRLLNGHYFE